MRTYERIFGSGPKGMFISISLLIVSDYLEDFVGLRGIFTSDLARFSTVILFFLLGIALFIWSLKSLSPEDRGKKLVTEGAYKYFRHPVYAAFLLFINFGIAFLLNNLIYLFWVVILFPVWSFIIRGEEALMKNAFNEEYDAYCKNTWRFVPKLWH